MNRRFPPLLLAAGAVLMAVATALGALASHALGSALDPQALSSFNTAVDYQFWHALGLIALAIYSGQRPASLPVALAAGLILAGLVLFCGGVYASSLDGPRWLARLAPTGGSALILGWLAIAVIVVLQGRPAPAQRD